MFLSSLRLHNIRCFADAFIDFDADASGANRKWTVLLGENGTGKSTVLRSASLALAGPDALTELLGDPADWLRMGADSGFIETTIETKRGERRNLRLDFQRGDTISSFVSRSIEGLAPLVDALSHTSRNYFVAAYGATRRLGMQGSSSDRAASRFRHPRSRSVATLFDRDVELNPLESWAMDLDYRHPEGLTTVRDVLSDFLPGVDFATIDKQSRRLLFDTPDGPVPLHQLSEGYKNVAAWIGDLLFRISETFEDYRSPLSTRGLLVIDEIDLHLHPVWQRRLIDFLDRKLPNIQLLVTTHSPVTAQQAGPNAIHVLKRGPEAVSIEPFAPDPGGLLVNQLLMTEAFGLKTDESLRQEQDRDRLRTLSRAERLTAAESLEVEVLAKSVASVAPPSPTLLRDDQMRFLEEVKATLEKASGRQ